MNFTQNSINIISEANNFALKYQNSEIKLEHLTLAMLSQNPGLIRDILLRLEYNVDEMIDKLRSKIQSFPKVSNSNLAQSREFSICLMDAKNIMEEFEDKYISVEHIFLSIYRNSNILKDFGIDKNRFMQMLKSIRGDSKVVSENPENTYEVLEKYGQDLVSLVKEGKIDPIIGRDDEIRRTVQILSRRNKNNPILIGEPGVGKTAVVGYCY